MKIAAEVRQKLGRKLKRFAETWLRKAFSPNIEPSERATGLMRGRGPAAGDWLLLESSQARASRPG